MKTELSEVLHVDKNKCVKCHKCISVCPAKYCNESSDEYVKVNKNMCIACGTCIQACTHDARRYIDDIQLFLDGIENGERMVAIVAPAIASNFPENYLRINGFLKELGVLACFDVSFGAELTIKSYIETIKNEKPVAIISQPCPAIVSYIEIYCPELIPYLAPSDSPMMHTMKMIREYYTEYSDCKIVVISPCVAKRREFDEVGLGNYNVTIKSISDYIDEQGLDLNLFPEFEFDNPPAERAVLFSSPGGLLRTAMREYPQIVSISRKIEGKEYVYPYFDTLFGQIQEKYSPLLIDCLSCYAGCNGGPGTLNQEKPLDKIEHWVEKRNKEYTERYKGKDNLAETIETYWKKNLYTRKYINLSGNNIVKIPTKEQLEKAFVEMKKIKEADFYNCAFCGYNTCEKMAIAIFNNLNSKENCYHYKSEILTELADKLNYTVIELHKSLDEVAEFNKQLQNFSKKINTDFNQMMSLIDKNSETLKEFRRIIETIDYIASRTDLLSINAAIEAARAGEYGNTFSIVATEVRKLADNTKKESEKIKPCLVEINKMFVSIKQMLTNSVSEFNNSNTLNSEITNDISDVLKLIDNLQLKTQDFLSQTQTVLAKKKQFN